jgi:5-methylcytosine-specific restriction endonuclease McrA
MALKHNSRHQRNKVQANLRRRLRRAGDTSPVCHWCAQEIVWIGEIRRYNRRTIRAFDVDFIDLRTGELENKRIATADHIVPLGEGGTNEDENIVPACAECNHHRNVAAQKKDKLVFIRGKLFNIQNAQTLTE